jgi:hypothetical protein
MAEHFTELALTLDREKRPDCLPPEAANGQQATG